MQGKKGRQIARLRDFEVETVRPWPGNGRCLGCRSDRRRPRVPVGEAAANQPAGSRTLCVLQGGLRRSLEAARILLPVRYLRFWIDSNILLGLKDAPFNKRDAHLVPAAGSCADCPKPTGHNKLLFGDDLGRQGCTDPNCYQAKVSAHVAQIVAAKPGLVQINTAYGGQKEGSSVLPRNKYIAIRDDKRRFDDMQVLILPR